MPAPICCFGLVAVLVLSCSAWEWGLARLRGWGGYLGCWWVAENGASRGAFFKMRVFTLGLSGDRDSCLLRIEVAYACLHVFAAATSF